MFFKKITIAQKQNIVYNTFVITNYAFFGIIKKQNLIYCQYMFD